MLKNILNHKGYKAIKMYFRPQNIYEMTVTEFEPIIEVIEEAYEIPHLNATRKISALLPHDYYHTDKQYPVLYLQDGQNLFNPMADRKSVV